MPRLPITTKHAMYAALNAGLLGYTLPAVETPPELDTLLARGGRFAIRLKQSGGHTRFNLTPDEVRAELAKLSLGSWNVSPMLDDTQRVCYGHLINDVGGWRLHYSDDPKPCKLLPSKDGCTEKHMTGLAARLYLRRIMDDVGWETLNWLLDEYPDHVVEFSVMASRLASFGPTNTIIWEVRCTTGAYEASSGWC